MTTSMPKPREYWIRDERGDIFGPLTYATIELFLESGLFTGALMASADGLNFDVPGHFPDLRDAFPKTLWCLDENRTSRSSDDRNPVPKTPLDNGNAFVNVVNSSAPTTEMAPSGIGRLPFAGLISFESQPLNLCHRAVCEKATGLLTFQSDLRRYALYFRKGTIESVESPRPDEDVGAFAVTQHTLTSEQLQEARDLGGNVLDALFKLNHLNPASVSELLLRHRTSLLFKAILISEGTFSFNPDADRPANALSIGELWLPLCQVARVIPGERLLQGLGRRIEWPVMSSGGNLNVDIRQLSLTAQERRISSQFDGTRSLVELCEAMPDAQSLPILRTAYLLASLEAISFASEGATNTRSAASVNLHRRLSRIPTPAFSTTPPPQRFGTQPPLSQQGTPAPQRFVTQPPLGRQGTPGPQRFGTPPPVVGWQGTPPPIGRQSTASPQRFGSQLSPAFGMPAPSLGEIEKLSQLLSSLSTKNHFEVLDVPQTSEGTAFKQAFFKLAKSYHPDTAIATSPEVAKLKADIFSRMNEAYQVLDNPISRAQYIESLQASDDLKGDMKIDATQVLGAEEKYFKATVFMKNRKYKEAVLLMDEVINLNPREGEFIACRGFAGFLAASDKSLEKPKALKAIEEGLALNPRCAEAYYFRGQIEKITGAPQLAKQSFQECLKLNPKHVEAQRELNWMEKK